MFTGVYNSNSRAPLSLSLKQCWGRTQVCLEWAVIIAALAMGRVRSIKRNINGHLEEIMTGGKKKNGNYVSVDTYIRENKKEKQPGFSVLVGLWPIRKWRSASASILQKGI